MNVFFRADASIEIGSGHVMRCLTLAGALRESGANVSFICRELPGNLCGFIEEKGFKAFRLPGNGVGTDAVESAAILSKEENAHWLIIDHYAINNAWHARMRPLTKRLMAIDDLACREFDCDILLNQNLYDDMDERYAGLLPGHCKRLFGPEYALLRPEFREGRKMLRQRDGRVRRILVFYGGSDPTNETSKALRGIQSLNMPQIAVDAVVGGSNPNGADVERHAFALPGAAFYRQTDDMAALMARADLAIGAGGSSSWERCCMGLPAIVTVIAENQAAIAENLAEKGIVVNLGWHANVFEADIEKSLRRLLDSPEATMAMSVEASRLVDGMGVARVVDAMMHGG